MKAYRGLVNTITKSHLVYETPGWLRQLVRQSTYPFLNRQLLCHSRCLLSTPIAGFLQTGDRRVRPRLGLRHGTDRGLGGPPQAGDSHRPSQAHLKRVAWGEVD